MSRCMCSPLLPIVLYAALVLVALCPGSSAQPQPTPEKIVLATGQQGGIYLKLGHAIADVAKRHGLDIEVLSSHGSVENVHHLVEKRADMAFVQSDIAHSAWARHPPFGSLSLQESSSLRLVTPLYTEVVQILVRPHLYVLNTAGLRRKKVSLGRQGSGTHQTALAVLEASGLAEEDVEALHLPLDRANEQVKNGTIDAVFRSSAVPTPLVARVLEESEVRLLRLDREVIDRLVEGEAYVETSIPRGTYPRQTKIIPTIAIQALLLVDDQAPPLLVARLMEILHREQGTIEQVAGVRLERLGVRMATNLRSRAHPGGLAYLPDSSDWLDNLAIAVVVLLVVLFFFLLYRSPIGQLLLRRRLSRRHMKPREELLFVVALLLCIWILGSLGLYLTEGDVNEEFDTILKSAWSMLVYVAGGFQARVPMTHEGEAVAVFATAFGVAVVAWVASEFATHLVRNELDRLIKLLKGEKSMAELKDHIVIINWDERVKEMVRQLRGQAFKRKVTILVISEQGIQFPEERVFDEVGEVVGDPTNKRILERAEVQHAHSVTILSTWPSSDLSERRRRLDPEVADAKTITTILAIRDLTPDRRIPITAEIRTKKNCQPARTAGREQAIEIVCAEEFGIDVLTQCAITPGLAGLYTDLLTFTPESNEIYTIKVPDNFVGKTFGDLLQDFAERRRATGEAIIPLGISRGSRIYLNPRDDDKEVGPLEPGDFLFVISYTMPEFA